MGRKAGGTAALWLQGRFFSLTSLEGYNSTKAQVAKIAQYAQA
jgi:hypothetical protein